MHLHVAIFKWKDGVTTEQVDDALQMVRSVRSRVDGLVGIYCGQNDSKWSQGFSHAVVVVGKTAQAIADYRADEIHEVAAALIDKMELDGIGVDFSDFN